MDLGHICFDLDGTIVNSFPTIYKCTLRTLEHLNISDPLEEKGLYDMIGYHFLDIFEKLKINVADVESFINIYKTYYFEYIDDSVLYPGTLVTLKSLKDNGLKISLLTTKAQDQADMLIDHFELRPFFDAVYGRKNGLAIKPDAEPLLAICNELDVNPSSTLMVGDSDLDIRCGKNAGAKTCAVSYGYRKLAVLREENPDYIIHNIPDLLQVVF
ncbi:MAG: HAD family hydrolase [Ignavibacteriales bacterium]|nr:MAG: HAD family hydrolase [Ignavibacteriales bacterium]